MAAPTRSTSPTAQTPARKVYENPYVFRRILLHLPYEAVQKMYALEKAFLPIGLELVGRSKVYSKTYLESFERRHGPPQPQPRFPPQTPIVAEPTLTQQDDSHQLALVSTLDHSSIAPTLENLNLRLDQLESRLGRLVPLPIPAYLASSTTSYGASSSVHPSDAVEVIPDNGSDSLDQDLVAMAQDDDTEAVPLENAKVPNDVGDHSHHDKRNEDDIDEEDGDDDEYDDGASSGRSRTPARPPVYRIAPTTREGVPTIIHDHFHRSVRSVRVDSMLACGDDINVLRRWTPDKQKALLRQCPNVAHVSGQPARNDYDPVESWYDEREGRRYIAWSMDILRQAITLEARQSINWPEGAEDKVPANPLAKCWPDYTCSSQIHVEAQFYNEAGLGVQDWILTIASRPDVISLKIDTYVDDDIHVFDSLTNALISRRASNAPLKKLSISGQQHEYAAITPLVAACEGVCGVLSLRNVSTSTDDLFSHIFLDTTIPPGTCVQFDDCYYDVDSLPEPTAMEGRPHGLLDIMLRNCNRVGIADLRFLGWQLGACLRTLYVNDGGAKVDSPLLLENICDIVDLVRNDMPLLETLALVFRSRDSLGTYEDSAFAVPSGPWGGKLKTLEFTIYTHDNSNHSSARVPYYAIASNVACLVNMSTTISVYQRVIGNDDRYCETCYGGFEENDTTDQRGGMTATEFRQLVRHFLGSVQLSHLPLCA